MELIQNWRNLANLQFSMIVGLPTIMLGYLLVIKYSLYDALISVIIASITLFILAIVSSSLALSKRITTIQYSFLFFGSKGMQICSLAMGISLFGWFIINLSFISNGVSQILTQFNLTHPLLPIFINITFGIFITLIVMRDLKFISKFAAINVPLLFITLLYMSYKVSNINTMQHLSASKDFNCTGIFLILASLLGVIIDIPTYYRFAASLKDAWISSFITFLIIVPLVFSVGIVLAVFTYNINIVKELTDNGGLLLNIWSLAFLIISGCLISNSNLYSSQIALQPLFQNLSNKKIILMLGIMASLISCLKIISHFEIWLDGISILISSMASVMFTTFIINKFKLTFFDTKTQIQNTIALIIGSGFGLLSFLHLIIGITGFSFIDASLVASCLTIIFKLPRVFNYVNFARQS